LLEEVGRLRIVAVFSCPTEQTFDFSTVACVTTIEERDSKMILRFFAAVFGCVVRPDGRSVGPDSGGRMAASAYPILETVTDLKPSIPVVRASRTSPPLKGSSEVSQFAVCSGDVVRYGCVPEA
jgi:4-hydroxy-3-methylbut-2-en-1-yl diphosphate synthase IspG/GcpE